MLVCYRRMHRKPEFSAEVRITRCANIDDARGLGCCGPQCLGDHAVVYSDGGRLRVVTA